ncbi:MAG: DegT/DnrJ/EryC1/StrS family aminotransferase [Candidatus Nanopelagicales bacterium]|nr:DegT/DnrJ/EryC1/StrS family aminotransferase [Candidatus Nanopelagicales bacterium]
MSPADERVYLSAPRALPEDIASVTRALESGWLAPVGPELSGFESDIAEFIGVKHAVGLSSGTAALHLGLKYLGVKSGDYVIVPTMTFAATAFAVTYLGAIPVFVDVDQESWNLDPILLDEVLTELAKSGKKVSAVIPVDLYGTPCNYLQILTVCERHGVPVLEDAAEGLGASLGGARLGSYGRAGVLSFNGNKLITTSGGGMLVTDDDEFAAKVRYWSTQARSDNPWYEHTEIGYNYRLSNILAALGRSQLRRVPREVETRRSTREMYRDLFACMPGMEIQQDPSWGTSNAWLTVVRFDLSVFPNAPTRVREFLESNNVESRPIWKPMHRQPVFASNPKFLTGIGDELFENGLCLPSGTGLDSRDIERVASLVIECLES